MSSALGNRIKSLRADVAVIDEKTQAKQAEIDRLLADFSLEYALN